MRRAAPPAAEGINFFPTRGELTRPAKNLCAQCPVQAQCLTYALDHGEKCGIWGGASERERRGMRATVRRSKSTCGTLGGLSAHRRRGEPSCAACLEANATHLRERRAQDRRTA